MKLGGGALSDQVETKKAFQTFMSDYSKSYGRDEFRDRFQNFADNYRFIKQHDAEATGFTVGINEFADMSNEEFNRMYLGFVGDYQAARSGNVHDASLKAAPTSMDWRQAGAVTGVKNQGQCGSCWSFSATGSTEGAWFLAGNTLVGLSESNLVDCSQSEGNMGCNGGLMDYAFEYIIKNNGIDTESSYPYVPETESCKFNAANVGATLSSYQDIASGSETDLTNAIGTIGPISVAIDASHTSFQTYTGGVYYEPACSSTALDHGVLAIGYGSDSGTDYYLVKNSWGTSWGLQGYIMMSRNRNNNCGIATDASYPIV
jgi:cathepsin L